MFQSSETTLQGCLVLQQWLKESFLFFCFLVDWFFVCLFFVFVFLVFLGLHSHHIEVPRLGVKSELQLPAYTTATVTQDLSHVCDLHHSSHQSQIPDPLSKARDRTHVLMDSFPLSHDGNSRKLFEVDNFQGVHSTHDDPCNYLFH